MTETLTRALDATQTLLLGSGDAFTVARGTVLMFVVPRTGGVGARRIPLGQVVQGGGVVGADLPDADILITGLPDTLIERTAPADPAQIAAMTETARAALAADQERAAGAADLLRLQESHEQRLIEDSLLGLVAAVPGDRRAAINRADFPRLAGVVDATARQVGLHPDPLRLRRALTDAEVTGRDPIASLAGAAGASLRRVELPPDWWRREGPALMVSPVDAPDEISAVSWRNGHYRMWPAADGADLLVDAAVDRTLDRRATVLEPLLDPRRPASLTDLLRIGLQGSRRSMLLVAVLTVVVGLLAAVIPIVAGALTQTVASQTTSTLLVVGCALVALAAGNMMLQAVRSFALLRIRGRAVGITAAAVWDRLLRLPMSWQNRTTVASRMTDANAVDMASMSMSDATITALLDVATVVGALIGIFTTSGALALGVGCFLVVRGLVEYGLIKRSARVTRQVLDASTDSQSVILQMVRGVNCLRLSGATARAFARWATVQSVTTRREVQRRRLTIIQQVTGAMWPVLGLAVIFVITAIVSADVGQLVTAQTALTASTSALAAAIAAMGALLSARAIMQRVEPVMTSEPESGTGQEVAQLAGAIDARDLVFRYRDDLPPVLDGVNLSIPAGAHVAIVGPSGCGKSTLLRLLLGLEDPDSGIVSFDGRDLSGLDRSAVRRQIGTVMQSSQLLPGSIRENVDLGRGLSPDEIWAALAEAAVADDVRAMPMGLSTAVVEGSSTISGGQRQRILMARALAGRPRILILDEATSALDNLSQAAIVANLDRIDTTRVVVAHRLSTIERADLIVMLDSGRVVEQGTFADLMAARGPFWHLVERQRV
ncbi:MAG: ATP-binding cassette domain-containing protein [Candidatus Nanopelagicales bacterium]